MHAKEHMYAETFAGDLPAIFLSCGIHSHAMCRIAELGLPLTSRPV